MATTSSPWAQPGTVPPAERSGPQPETGLGPPPRPRSPMSRHRTPLWLCIAALLTIAISAAGGSVATYMALQGHRVDSETTAADVVVAPSWPTPSAPTDSLAAKNYLCHALDLSVSGQQGQGGLRVQGKPNIPVILRAINSALVVGNANVPPVPSDIAVAAHKYVSATFDETTAAMSSMPASEGARLTDARNEAMNELLDVCGLPR